MESRGDRQSLCHVFRCGYRGISDDLDLVGLRLDPFVVSDISL